MTNFEEKLRRLEELANDIKQSDITLENALKDFEEGIKLAKGMEKELDSIENKIQILMNTPDVDTNIEEKDESAEDAKAPKKKAAKSKAAQGPVLDFFDSSSELNGTRNA